MDHVFWIHDQSVGGRPGPNLIPWSPADLHGGGIGAVLSVNDGELVHVEDLTALGIDYLCAPLSENAPPREGDIEICLESLSIGFKFVTKNREMGRRTLVHCRQGRDRTGMFIAYFIYKQFGVSPDDAVKKLKEIRCDALAADGWDDFTLEVLQTS